MAARHDIWTKSKASDVEITGLPIRTEWQYGTEWKQTRRVCVVVQELTASCVLRSDVTEGRLRLFERGCVQREQIR
jgi:hypothetical protein